ncbi:hypothetical protein, partial [Escherichia coli]|uniref:hypothetical protein n=1 Tax=Escherichia coli TaxID=562 RepID=UPI0035B56D7F
APSAKGDDKFITTDYLQQCHRWCVHHYREHGLCMEAVPLRPSIGRHSLIATLESPHFDSGQDAWSGSRSGDAIGPR